MDIQRLARIEQIHNQVQGAIREHMAQFSEEQLFKKAESLMEPKPERLLLAMAYITELTRRYEESEMDDNH